MDKETIRLECLKLATDRCCEHTEAMSRAKEYEKFVVEPKEESSTKKVPKPGNSKLPK